MPVTHPSWVYTWIHGVLTLHFPPPPLTPRNPKCAPTRSRAAGMPPTQCSQDSPLLPFVPLPAPPLWNFSVSEHLENAPHRILGQEVGQAWQWCLFCTQSKVRKGGQGLGNAGNRHLGTSAREESSCFCTPPCLFTVSELR